MRLDASYLKKNISNIDILQGDFLESPKFSVDTRTLKQGDVFVALKGESSDGHDFVEHAIDAGASGFIIQKNNQDLLKKINQDKLKNKLIILVDDVFKFLTKLANCWRSEFNIPVVGVTGSVGKTSTKELLRNIALASGKKYLITEGNQNTMIGVSLNILRLDSTYQGAVFELGISKRNEMAQLVKLLNPTSAVITEIGHSHMSGLGSLADISLEKRQIFSAFTEKNVGVINGDNQWLANIAYKHPVVRFGFKTTNQIQGRKVKIVSDGISLILKIYKNKYNIKLSTFNRGFINNVLAASSVAYLLGFSDKDIVAGVQIPLKVDGRFKINKLKNGKGILIDDCYNASPESMKSALIALSEVSCTGRKIAVVGDMFELGIDSMFWHRQLGRFFRKALNINKVIFVGEMVKYAVKSLPVSIECELVEDWTQALKLVDESLTSDSIVLVKGSTYGYKKGLVNLVKELSDDKSDEASKSEYILKDVKTKRAKVI